MILSSCHEGSQNDERQISPRLTSSVQHIHHAKVEAGGNMVNSKSDIFIGVIAEVETSGTNSRPKSASFAGY